MQGMASSRASINGGYSYRDQIGRAPVGSTVVGYLAGRYRHSPEALWRLRVGRGEVSLDGRTLQADEAVCPGQVLVWSRPPWCEPEVPLQWALLYRDRDLLAVAKPRGLPTVPAGGFLEHTLLMRVRVLFPEAVPAHRLGRGTSGLVLFARTAKARAALARAWREGEVRKVYRALVTGAPGPSEFTVETPIGPVAHPVLGTVHAASPAGRPSRSHVRVLRTTSDRALVEVEIETGRPHQIRIHLAAAGFPLVGDPLYREGGQPRPEARPGETGYWLHAFRLELRHPASFRPLPLECLPPPALRLAGE
jgi:23S rRNA pseudouridine1911/1915/1917 synthase